MLKTRVAQPNSVTRYRIPACEPLTLQAEPDLVEERQKNAPTTHTSERGPSDAST